MGLTDEYLGPLLAVQQGPVTLRWDPTSIPQLGDEEEEETPAEPQEPTTVASQRSINLTKPTLVVTPPAADATQPASTARTSRQRRKAQMAVGF